MSAGGGGARAVVAALPANVAIAVATFVGFLVTGSSAMLAESVHSVADSGNQGLLLLGGRRARRAEDQEHPFGYGRERYFWAFVVALVLFTLGGLFSLYEGYRTLQERAEGQGLEAPGIALAILGLAIVAEGFSFRTALSESARVKGSQTWVRFLRTARSPELPVVVLQDLGALIGLALAFAGVLLTTLTGDLLYDALGTMAIGLLLLVLAVLLVVEMKGLLVGEGATGDQVLAIRTALVGDGVTRVIHLRTLHLGPDELLVGAKVALADDLDVARVARALDAAEERVRRVVPTARAMYLEPDLYRAEGPPGGSVRAL